VEQYVSRQKHIHDIERKNLQTEKSKIKVYWHNHPENVYLIMICVKPFYRLIFRWINYPRTVFITFWKNIWARVLPPNRYWENLMLPNVTKKKWTI
jgi:hypothetical protein